MSPSVPYHVAAVCLILFAVGHTLSFRKADPKWGIDVLQDSMRSIHFDVLGFDRTYWDFYVGKGLTITVLYLFSSILAWQLGSLPTADMAHLRLLLWAFPFCFAAITILNWRYFFAVPIAFSAVITLCLVVGAWLAPA